MATRLASPSGSAPLPDRLHLAYVTTGYPYVSHTFIQNEVLALRRLGVTIDTFALRREPLEQVRTSADREAWETTYPLRPPRIAHYARAHLSAIAANPAAYRWALASALWRGQSSLPALARQLTYFLQGVVLWHRCRLAGAHHIHAHFANVASDVAMIAASLGDQSLAWSFTMHGPTEFYDVSRFRLDEKASNACFVVCISDFARSQLMGLVAAEHWDDFEVVRCGVDTTSFTPAVGDRSGPLRITCVGRLVPEKGQRVLVEAVAQMSARGFDVRLALAGDGPERHRLERMAHDRGLAARVDFLGAIAHTRVRDLLDHTDLFCLPSFAEGVPIVLMEAMAMEIPVVACRVMGIPELVQDGISGCLVSPGSAADLVMVLSALASEPDRRRTLGRAARERVRAAFDLDENARRLKQVFDDRVPS